MEQLEVSPAWERAVIAYFLINGVRVKNALKRGNTLKPERQQGGRPTLRLVKVYNSLAKLGVFPYNPHCRQPRKGAGITISLIPFSLNSLSL